MIEERERWERERREKEKEESGLKWGRREEFDLKELFDLNCRLNAVDLGWTK